MKVSELIPDAPMPLTVPANTSVEEAARLMSVMDVGYVLVLGDDGLVRGVLTDRDLTVRVVSRHTRFAGIAVEEVMSSPVVDASPEEDSDVLLELMKRHGVRRIPIIRDGELFGVVTFEALIGRVAVEMAQLSAEGDRS